ncbi:PEP-CTERM-box response regulator transcription factor [Magnetospirillum moscoviense]|uniref:Sigma-54-dependent Fis family transcriptional regulator n=1 Tax=Magnetospirillum moscoviense TaxID=1437059 RepID=A0A178MTY3_9PROT|nr:PEP-CTERM-box response regulator transcription factor [Magnetospirillum moscoviense]MBF0324540.1 PEP-CTERM-box response regulator transcription factor [Alphaproteobacteria bacterium]OAN51561.1 sigma-54-dependent Fis family transcriptional regulator [Magnetospirillum moscoviense]
MNDDKRKILVIEDDLGLRTQLKWALANFEVLVAEDGPKALHQFERKRPPVVILDLGLPPDPNGASEGLATLEKLLKLAPLTKVIVASGNDERGNALKAIELGAYDFYPKPADLDVMRLIIDRALTLHDLEEENEQLALGRTSPLAGLVASSPEMLGLCRSAERVATANIAVLITGESGTGKEILARAVHDLSARAHQRFVAINCAAIPDNLLESELFGHEKGAFTGAVKQTIGKVEQAHHGTLFLDEIGDMPLSLQAKLLRFLQNRTIERIGGRKEIEVDVRVLSATNRDLAAMMTDGSFREDLYYRLNEVSMHMPPLRDRPGDAILLARYFRAKYAKDFQRAPKTFTTDALAAIARYRWPGNVRELENRVKRAMLMADGKAISSADLELCDDTDILQMPTLRQIRAQAEAEAVLRALAITDNNVSDASQLLGVSRPTLYEIMHAANMPINRRDRS